MSKSALAAMASFTVARLASTAAAMRLTAAAILHLQAVGRAGIIADFSDAQESCRNGRRWF